MVRVARNFDSAAGCGIVEKEKYNTNLGHHIVVEEEDNFESGHHIVVKEEDNKKVWSSYHARRGRYMTSKIAPCFEIR